MKCPGQDSRFWGPEAIFDARCPNCGGPVEFFKDESSRKCRKCGYRVLNPKMDFGCAAYCKFATQCLGDLPPELLAKRADLLKDRVAAAVKMHLGRDFKRIGRALKVAEHVQTIGRAEDADPAIATLSAYLSMIADGTDEGETAAGNILSNAGAPPDIIAEVLSTLRSLHKPEEVSASANSRSVLDAYRVAELEERAKRAAGAADVGEAVESLLTESGRETARRVLSEIADNS